MLRVLERSPQGGVIETDGDGLAAPPPPGAARWIDVTGPTGEELARLRERFSFHPLAIEDCESFDARSKLDTYDSALFVVLHTFTCPVDDPGQVVTHELHTFLTADAIVTVHEHPLTAIDLAWRRAAADPSLLERGPAWVLYTVGDVMVEQIFPILDLLTDEIEGLEEALLGRAERHDLAMILRLKRALVTMRRVLGPLRDVHGNLARVGDPRVPERVAPYFRHLQDHLLRCAERVDAARELLANALDLYHTVVSNRLNAVMKSLTIMSAIFLPLGFVTGFWGQNFADLPVGSHVHFAIMLGSLAAVPAALLYWFRRNGWF